EHPEGASERDVALSRQGAGHAHHLGFGHPDIDETVRDLVLEEVDLALTGQIGGQADDLRSLTGDLDQRFAIRLQDGGIGWLTRDAPPVPGERVRSVRAAAL